MTPARGIAHDGVDVLRSIAGPGAFATIAESGVDGVIWRRTPPASFRQWIDQLPSELLPAARVILRPQDAHAVVSHVCDAAATPRDGDGIWFVRDVARLTDAFAEALATSWVRLRIDVIFDDGCPKFHIDAVQARLICTYRGTGTQYGAIGGDEAEPERTLTVPTGAPIVLRGTKWPGPRRSALRHRSPPIAGSHAPRLVLVVEPVPEPSGDHPHDAVFI